MHFATTLVGFLAALAVASPVADIEVRAVSNGASVLKNITVIEADATTLNKTLNKYANNAKLAGSDLITIQQQSSKLADDLKTTAANVNKSAVFTEPQSGAIYNETNNKLKPIVTQLLANFVRHKPAFTSTGVASVVKSTLTQQRELTRQLGNSLTAKAAAPWKAKSPALANAILAEFDKAIKAYSS